MAQCLYYENFYEKEFTAQIVEVKKVIKSWEVLLDQTCFYPGGGGQPADHGLLNTVHVFDCKKENQNIWHLCSDNPGEGLITGSIDWKRRYDYMQQHSGQHIISAVAKKNNQFDTVSVHLGEHITTIDFSVPDLGEKELNEIENCANRVIQKNFVIKSIVTTDDKINSFPLRRVCNKKGTIRIIHIDSYDYVACGGVHCSTTGEVGLIKVIGKEKIRKNIRTIWKIGDRAFDDYSLKHIIISKLKPLFSVGEDGILDKVNQLQEQYKALERDKNEVEKKLAQKTAQELFAHNSSHKDVSYVTITKIWRGSSKSFIKKIMKELTSRFNVLVCFLIVDNSHLYWHIACTDTITFNFDTFRQELLPIIKGKGGGRHPWWNGMGTKMTELESFITQFHNKYSILSV